MASPEITPGYVWCADCHGLGSFVDGDDDCDLVEVDCSRCDGRGEHLPDDDHMAWVIETWARADAAEESHG